MIGLPSIIELPYRALVAERMVCVDFALQAIGTPVRRLKLAVAGIGSARLIERDAVGPPCEFDAAAGTPTLLLQNVGDTPRLLRLQLDPQAFPSAGAQKGRLLMLREAMAPLDAELTVQREDGGPTLKAAQWLLGVLIPALITAAFGLLVYRSQKWFDANNAEKEVLAKFNRDKGRELVKFFGAAGAFKPAAEQKDPDYYSEGMRRVLDDRGILAALPKKAADALSAALARADRRRVAELLCTSFPDHVEAIRKIQPQGG